MRGPGKQGDSFFEPFKKEVHGKKGIAKRLLAAEEIGDSSESDEI